METFLYQYENVEVYRKFVDFLGKKTSEIKEVIDIPFLPIEMFKNHLVLDKVFDSAQTDKPLSYFQSSGTTQIQTRSKHYIADFNLYEESIYKSFEQFIGKPEDYIFLGLLPNYSENPHSSLIYMVDDLIKHSEQKESNYFLYNHQDLFEVLQQLKEKGTKTVLFGVTYALLDFVEQYSIDFPELIIMETGGMKGKRKEMIREELHAILKAGFGVPAIHSEYGMTELMSQAYSKGDGKFSLPLPMRILLRDVNDPYSQTAKSQGGINVIDLGNFHSCAFIETQDLGKIDENGMLEVLGRFDNSELRGCNLLVQ